MRFIHAADIHLDSPLRGLARYEGAPVEEMRAATRRSLENLVSLATDPEEEICCVLIAGDVYDGDWRDYNTGLFFAKQMSVLRDAGIEVFLVRGNHDAESQITRFLKLPENVKVFSASKPETVCLESLGIAVHGQSFATRGVMNDLAASYPDAVPGFVNVALLHTSAAGYEGHDVCAPCSVGTLGSKGYQYWALGHIHIRQEICRPASPDVKVPWVVFAGNIQGRHVREAGPKGCTVVTVSDGEISSVESRELDVARWYVCTVDVSAAKNTDDAMSMTRLAIEERVAESPDHLLALRVEILGRCPANSALRTNAELYANQIRADATYAASGRVWVEKVKILTQDERRPQSVEGWRDVFDSLSQIAESEDKQRELLASLSDLKRRLPPEMRSGEDAINLDDPALIAEALPDVEQILTARLLDKEA